MSASPKISVKSTIEPTKKHGLIVWLTTESKKQALPSFIDKTTTDMIQETLIKPGVFTGKKGEQKLIIGQPHLLIVGLGKPKDITNQSFREIAGNMARDCQSNKIKDVGVFLDPSVSISDRQAQAFGEGITMGSYKYDALLSEKKPTTNVASLTIYGIKTSPQACQSTIQRGLIIGSSVNSARDLANAPANYMTPQLFVDKAKETFNGSSVNVSVIDKAKAEKMGMGGLLGVSKGSVEPPYLLILSHEPNKNEKPLCLVGKGVTFDAGGISIKPSSKMSEMKGDMGGAAAVFGAMSAVANLDYNRNIIGLIPLTENMPAGNALKPGDVITISNGKTVEILNTDAEGRLILADALSYAITQKAEEIVDLATLTGACLVALGTAASGLFSNNTALTNLFKKLPDATGENLWHLPLYDEYKELLKSDVADIANCYEGRYAGASTAAMFLKEFVQKTPWVHLDIAPTMSHSKTAGADVKGMSGSGVRTLIEYLDSKNKG